MAEAIGGEGLTCEETQEISFSHSRPIPSPALSHCESIDIVDSPESDLPGVGRDSQPEGLRDSSRWSQTTGKHGL
jgi:hypothetical protein